MAWALLRLAVCVVVLRDCARSHVLVPQAEAPPLDTAASAENDVLPDERQARARTGAADGLEQLRSCWAEDARGCEAAVSALLGREGHVQLADFAALEPANATEGGAEAAGGADAQGEEGRGATGLQTVLRQMGRLLRSRALRLNLWDVVELSARIAPDQPDSLEVALDQVEADPRDGRRSTRRMHKVIIPLVLGFKLTGALILGITVVKMFLVKAFVVSKLALLAALFMMIRKLLSAVGVQHHPYLYSQHKLPAYGLDAGYPAAAASDLSYAYHTGYYGGHYGAPGHYAAGDYGHYAAAAAVDNVAGPGAVGTGDDLQGHFSTNTVAVQQAPSTARNTTKMVARTDGLKHTVYGLVKSSAHRVPVNTYRKLVTTGRKMAP